MCIFLGFLLTEEKIKSLNKANLDEIRFHPNLEDKKHWKKLDLIKEIPWRILIPGHGPAIYNIREIDNTYSWLEYIRNKVKQGIEEAQKKIETLENENEEITKSIIRRLK